MSIRLSIFLKYSTNVVVMSLMAISQLALAEEDCRALGTYITLAKQNAGYMQFSRFTTENRPEAEAYNVAVDEVVKYINYIENDTGQKRIDCTVIAASRAKKIFEYAKNQRKDQRYNVTYASALQENLEKIKECVVVNPPPLDTKDQIYNYESAAYYACNGVLKP